MYTPSLFTCDLCGTTATPDSYGGMPGNWIKGFHGYGHACGPCVVYTRDAAQEAAVLAVARLRARPRKHAA